MRDWREQRVGSYPGDRSNGVRQMLVSTAPQPILSDQLEGEEDSCKKKKNHEEKNSQSEKLLIYEVL